MQLLVLLHDSKQVFGFWASLVYFMRHGVLKWTRREVAYKVLINERLYISAQDRDDGAFDWHQEVNYTLYTPVYFNCIQQHLLCDMVLVDG